MREAFRRGTLAGLLLLLCLPAGAEPIPPGDGYQVLRVGDVSIEIFTYKPASYAGGPLLMVFHGVDRNPDDYRDAAKVIGDRHGMVVVAPMFDKARFPSSLYQSGGVANKNVLQPQEKWTVTLAVNITDAVRREEAKPELPYYMIGHSAGGQFLSRLAAMAPNQAQRIIIANPSSYVFPSLTEAFPFGLAGATAKLADDAFLQHYLKAPITVYLGKADTGSHNRDDSAEAARQGANRYERGKNFFQQGQALAQQKGWAFGWRLVEVDDVGHSSKRMFAARKLQEALH